MSTADIPLLLDLAPSNMSPHNQLSPRRSNGHMNGTHTQTNTVHGNSQSAQNNLNIPSSNITPIENGRNGTEAMGRRRSNSQSQVLSLPNKPQDTFEDISEYSPHSYPSEPAKKRNNVLYYVTLAPLNDTFIKKHIPVAIFPETTKLGRPTATKNKPEVTNGYFESRVLSRTHAQLYIDPEGKLMLQDLGSSNGTFLNDVKLGVEAVELKVNDFVCLGFNVQSELNHKQIILRIENINVIGGASNELFRNHNSVQFKHLSFIEDIYSQINGTKKVEDSEKHDYQEFQHDFQQEYPDKAPFSFDNALFGDINPAVEDSLLGIYSPVNAGIYNNAQVTNNYGVFENFINTLVNNLQMAKRQSELLNSLEVFFQNYKQLNQELNTKYLDQRFKATLDDLRADIKKSKGVNSKLKEKYKLLELETTKKELLLNMKLSEVEKEKQSLQFLLDVSREDVKRLQHETVSALETSRVPSENEQLLPTSTYSAPSKIYSANSSEAPARFNSDEAIGRDDVNAGTLLNNFMKSKEDNDSVHSVSSIPIISNMNFKISTSANKPKTTTQDTQVEVHGLFSDLPKIGKSTEVLPKEDEKPKEIETKEDKEEDEEANVTTELKEDEESDELELEEEEALIERIEPDVTFEHVQVAPVFASSETAVIVAVLVAVAGSVYMYARSTA